MLYCSLLCFTAKYIIKVPNILLYIHQHSRTILPRPRLEAFQSQTRQCTCSEWVGQIMEMSFQFCVFQKKDQERFLNCSKWNLQRLFERSVLFKLQDHLLVLLQMRKGANLLIFDFSFSYTSLLSFTFYRYVFLTAVKLGYGLYTGLK